MIFQVKRKEENVWKLCATFSLPKFARSLLFSDFHSTLRSNTKDVSSKESFPTWTCHQHQTGPGITSVWPPALTAFANFTNIMSMLFTCVCCTYFSSDLTRADIHLPLDVHILWFPTSWFPPKAVRSILAATITPRGRILIYWATCIRGSKSHSLLHVS